MIRANKPLQVNVHEAKTSLSQLLARVEKGEEIIIARDGKPVAKLTAARALVGNRVPGTGKAAILHIADDFDEMPLDIIEDFEKSGL